MTKIIVQIESADDVRPTAESIQNKWNFELKEGDKIKVTDVSERNEELLKALNLLLNSEYSSGCPMCDSGILRNPEKKHWDDCNWDIARKIHEKYK